MKTMIRTFVVCMAFMSLAAFASDYVPSDIAWLVTSMSSGDPAYWPTNAGQWQVEGQDPLGATANLDSTQDYGVKGGKNFRSKIGTATFSGKSLTIGALDRSSNGVLLFRTSNGCDTTFDNEGMFLYNGSIQSWNAGTQTVRGRVTVRSPDTYPATIVFTTKGGELVFRCPVDSAAGTGLYIHSLSASSSTMNQTNFVCRFMDDALANYNGTIVCCPIASNYCNNVTYYNVRYNSNLNPPYFVTFQTDSGTMPGTLKLYPNAIIAAEAPTTDFSVGTLSSISLNGFGTNYLSVAMAEDGSACSILRVTATLNLQSPMAIRLSTANTPNKAEATRLAILKAPSGVTLNPEMFFIERNDALPYLPDYELEVSTDAEDGLSTLWLVRSRPVVWTKASDGYQQTFYTRGNNFWSDNTAASGANDYLALHAIRTPLTTDTTVQEFSGHSLSISNVSLSLCSPVVRIGDLRVWNGSIANLSDGDAAFDFMEGILNGSWVLEGRMRLAADGTLTLNCYNSKGMRIDSEISGGGLVEIQNQHQNNSGTVTSSPRIAFVGLFGSNADFQGRIIVKQMASSPNFVNRLGSNLAIRNSDNLGGPFPQWTYDALTLQNFCGLHPLESLTLDDETRGIYLSYNYAFFTVTNDVVFTCKERITYNARLIKEGMGELALGGPQPYFVSNGTTTPTANKNVLDVWEGTLRPVSATAFQGLAVIVTNANATLAMDVPVSNDDGDIGQYGMLNTTWDAPLTVPESGLVVQLRDPNGVLADGRSHRVPILTVNATARAALDGKLSVAVPSSCAYSVRSVDWTDNGDETYTLSATISKGFILIYQ